MSKTSFQMKLLQNLKIPLFHKLVVLSLNISCLPKLLTAFSFIWSQFQLLELLAKTCILCLFGHEISSLMLQIFLRILPYYQLTGFVLFISAYAIVIGEFEDLMTDLENLQVKLAWITAL